MGKCAQIAYLDAEAASKKYKALGYPNHVFIENEGAQCHIVWNEVDTILAVRGTEPDEFSDIKADLNAIPRKAKTSGFVHMGFQNEVDKIWNTICSTLYEQDRWETDHYICGHSLGGAMATIAAARLSNPLGVAIAKGLFTYGSPRVGSRGFSKTISCIHYRHVNNNDIVTKVPFAFMGYKHNGELRYINHYGKIRPMTYWQRFKDQWRGRKAAWKKGAKFDGAYDHGMDYYVKYTEDE